MAKLVKHAWVALLLGLAACSGGSNNPPSPPSPSPSQWSCSGCSGVSVDGNGGFNFPNSSGAVGYVYTGANGNIGGKTITMTYTVSGSGTVVPSPASGSGQAQVRLFIWRRGDDLQCTSTTEWFRWWSATGAGPLTDGQHTISAVVSEPGWSDCYGHSDAGQLQATTANLLGVGYTFGAEFYGHGVYSTGSNIFTLNSFTVQ